MSVSLLVTRDQSHTLYNSELDETYHSRNGAVEESLYVFLKQGLEQVVERYGKAKVLEVGFGTGLNAILTLIYAGKHKAPVYYHSLETLPLPGDITAKLNYADFFDADYHTYYTAMHSCSWNAPVEITPFFTLFKHECSVHQFTTAYTFDVIYFDAFGPDKQPDMWTPEVFLHLYSLLDSGGIFVTYSSKGDVKRALRNAGFIVERLPGPPMKRHMLRAIKP